MRKIIVKVLTVGFFLFTLSACGGGETYDNNNGGSQPAPAPAPAPEPSPEPTPAPVTYSVTLSWTAPTTYTDGSPLSLSQIGGYRVYYGTVSGQYTKSVDVRNGTAQQQAINGLNKGTYYFTVVTYDVNNITSSYAQEISITL